jgi:glycosyltransferase involved in cell wall biosynthesis
MKCSVIIPSYDSEQTIIPCLSSVMAQDLAEPYEVIVVDSSKDRTPYLIRKQFPTVKLIHLERRTDPGTARNIGIAKAQGEILAFIDSDCVASHDWLQRMIRAHDSQHRVVGGAIENGNPDTLISRAGYVIEFREFLPIGLPRMVKHIPTCNISYKREVFTNYGGFRGDFYPQEDLLYNWEIRQKGERILFDPAIRVAHHHRTKLRDYLKHQVNIGQVTPWVLKRTDLPGSFIAAQPWLATLALPLLPLVKFIRTVTTFLRLQPETILHRPFLLPLLLLGLIFWGVGFARGTYEGGPDEARRGKDWNSIHALLSQRPVVLRAWPEPLEPGEGGDRCT